KPIIRPTPTPTPTPKPKPPKLSVNPTSFTLPRDPNCKISANGGSWTCYTRLTNTGKVSLNWVASSNGAFVSPSSGKLSPGHSVLVVIDVKCSSYAVTFSGPANSVDVAVNCSTITG